MYVVSRRLVIADFPPVYNTADRPALDIQSSLREWRCCTGL